MQRQKLVYKALSIAKWDFEKFELKILKFLKFRTTGLGLLLIVTRDPFIFEPKDNKSC